MKAAHEVFSEIQAIYKESLEEVFGGFDCSVVQVSDLDKEPVEAPISRIDCGSDEFELTILVRMPMSVLAMTYPIPDVVNIDESELEDWIAEISNQLIGKIKARLYSHNCDVKIGLPSAFFGAEMASLMPETSMIAEYYFHIDNEPCETLICMEAFEENITFSDQQIEEDPFEEGELELF